MLRRRSEKDAERSNNGSPIKAQPSSVPDTTDAITEMEHNKYFAPENIQRGAKDEKRGSGFLQMFSPRKKPTEQLEKQTESQSVNESSTSDSNQPTVDSQISHKHIVIPDVDIKDNDEYIGEDEEIATLEAPHLETKSFSLFGRYFAAKSSKYDDERGAISDEASEIKSQETDLNFEQDSEAASNDVAPFFGLLQSPPQVIRKAVQLPHDKKNFDGNETEDSPPPKETFEQQQKRDSSFFGLLKSPGPAALSVEAEQSTPQITNVNIADETDTEEHPTEELVATEDEPPRRFGLFQSKPSLESEKETQQRLLMQFLDKDEILEQQQAQEELIRSKDEQNLARDNSKAKLKVADPTDAQPSTRAPLFGFFQRSVLDATALEEAIQTQAPMSQQDRSEEESIGKDESSNATIDQKSSRGPPFRLFQASLPKPLEILPVEKDPQAETQMSKQDSSKEESIGKDKSSKTTADRQTFSAPLFGIFPSPRPNAPDPLPTEERVQAEAQIQESYKEDQSSQQRALHAAISNAITEPNDGQNMEPLAPKVHKAQGPLFSFFNNPDESSSSLENKTTEVEAEADEKTLDLQDPSTKLQESNTRTLLLELIQSPFTTPISSSAKTTIELEKEKEEQLLIQLSNEEKIMAQQEAQQERIWERNQPNEDNEAAEETEPDKEEDAQPSPFRLFLGSKQNAGEFALPRDDGSLEHSGINAAPNNTGEEENSAKREGSSEVRQSFSELNSLYEHFQSSLISPLQTPVAGKTSLDLEKEKQEQLLLQVFDEEEIEGQRQAQQELIRESSQRFETLSRTEKGASSPPAEEVARFEDFKQSKLSEDGDADSNEGAVTLEVEGKARLAASELTKEEDNGVSVTTEEEELLTWVESAQESHRKQNSPSQKEHEDFGAAEEAANGKVDSKSPIAASEMIKEEADAASLDTNEEELLAWVEAAQEEDTSQNDGRVGSEKQSEELTSEAPVSKEDGEEEGTSSEGQESSKKPFELAETEDPSQPAEEEVKPNQEEDAQPSLFQLLGSFKQNVDDPFLSNDDGFREQPRDGGEDVDPSATCEKEKAATEQDGNELARPSSEFDSPVGATEDEGARGSLYEYFQSSLISPLQTSVAGMISLDLEKEKQEQLLLQVFDEEEIEGQRQAQQELIRESSQRFETLSRTDKVSERPGIEVEQARDVLEDFDMGKKDGIARIKADEEAITGVAADAVVNSGDKLKSEEDNLLACTEERGVRLISVEPEVAKASDGLKDEDYAAMSITSVEEEKEEASSQVHNAEDIDEAHRDPHASLLSQLYPQSDIIEQNDPSASPRRLLFGLFDSQSTNTPAPTPAAEKLSLEVEKEKQQNLLTHFFDDGEIKAEQKAQADLIQAQSNEPGNEHASGIAEPASPVGVYVKPSGAAGDLNHDEKHVPEFDIDLSEVEKLSSTHVARGSIRSLSSRFLPLSPPNALDSIPIGEIILPATANVVGDVDHFEATGEAQNAGPASQRASTSVFGGLRSLLPSVSKEKNVSALAMEKERQQKLLIEQLQLDENDVKREQEAQKDLIKQSIRNNETVPHGEEAAINKGIIKPTTTDENPSLDEPKGERRSSMSSDSSVLLWWRTRRRDKIEEKEKEESKKEESGMNTGTPSPKIAAGKTANNFAQSSSMLDVELGKAKDLEAVSPVRSQIKALAEPVNETKEAIPDGNDDAEDDTGTETAGKQRADETEVAGGAESQINEGDLDVAMAGSDKAPDAKIADTMEESLNSPKEQGKVSEHEKSDASMETPKESDSKEASLLGNFSAFSSMNSNEMGPVYVQGEAENDKSVGSLGASERSTSSLLQNVTGMINSSKILSSDSLFELEKQRKKELMSLHLEIDKEDLDESQRIQENMIAKSIELNKRIESFQSSAAFSDELQEKDSDDDSSPESINQHQILIEVVPELDEGGNASEIFLKQQSVDQGSANRSDNAPGSGESEHRFSDAAAIARAKETMPNDSERNPKLFVSETSGVSAGSVESVPWRHGVEPQTVSHPSSGEEKIRQSVISQTSGVSADNVRDAPWRQDVEPQSVPHPSSGEEQVRQSVISQTSGVSAGNVGGAPWRQDVEQETMQISASIQEAEAGTSEEDADTAEGEKVFTLSGTNSVDKKHSDNGGFWSLSSYENAPLVQTSRVSPPDSAGSPRRSANGATVSSGGTSSSISKQDRKSGIQEVESNDESWPFTGSVEEGRDWINVLSKENESNFMEERPGSLENKQDENTPNIGRKEIAAEQNVKETTQLQEVREHKPKMKENIVGTLADRKRSKKTKKRRSTKVKDVTIKKPEVANGRPKAKKEISSKKEVAVAPKMQSRRKQSANKREAVRSGVRTRMMELQTSLDHLEKKVRRRQQC